MKDRLKKLVLGNNFLLITFLCTVALVGIYELVFLAKFGNTPQVYKDIVLEELAQEFLNKTVEFRLYLTGTLIGAFILLASFILRKKNVPIEEEKKWNEFFLVTGIFSLQILTSCIFFSFIKNCLILALFILLLAVFLKKSRPLNYLCAFFITLYSFTALYRVEALFIAKCELNFQIACIFAFLSVCLLLFFNESVSRKFILLAQIPVPFLFLIYLTDKYDFQGKVLVLKPSFAVYAFVFAVIAFSLAAVIFRIVKYWNRKNIFNAISIAVPIAIMCFQRYSGAPGIMVSDMHHPAENTIAFHEIVDFGLKVFKEYSPVSGFYSFVQGFFFEVFAGGNYISYSISNNIYYTIIIILTVFALRLHLNSFWTLVFSSLLFISDYSRVVLIIPFMAILLSRQLIRRENIWFTVWILLGLFYGLYYPAYGASIVVAMLPLGGFQAKKILSGWKKQSKKWKVFTIGLWSVTGAIVLFFVPVLIGLAKHTLAMGDNLICLDGVTVFGQSLPKDFLAYLNNVNLLSTIRLMIGYVVRFTVPMLVMWICLASLINFVNFNYGKKIELNVFHYKLIVCLLFPVVCFYFSLYRMGAYSLFNRAVYIIEYSLVVLALVLAGKRRISKNVMTLVLLSAFVFSICNNIGINELSDKYFLSYTISDDFVFTDVRSDLPRLGKGFVRKDLMDSIENAAGKFSKLDKARNYFALFSNYMTSSPEHGMAYDVILNIKGAGLLEMLTVRSYRATIKNIEQLLRTNAVIGNAISPTDHYYLYKWIMTSGSYIWSENDEVFYPAENVSYEKVMAENSRAEMKMDSENVWRYAASLGNSMDSLCKVLKSSGTDFKIKIDEQYLDVAFDEAINGNDVDFIYLNALLPDSYKSFAYGAEHLAKNKLEKVFTHHDYNLGLFAFVEWNDDEGKSYRMKAYAENGKLLIPIGGGEKWLCNKHQNVRIWFESLAGVAKLPPVVCVEMYRVRDIDIDIDK